MKKILCVLLIIFLQFSLVSCEKTSKSVENNEKLFANYSSNSDELNIHKATTKVYFAENRYVSFDISEDFIVHFENDDIVFFDDGTAMAKLYSMVNITPSNNEFIKIFNGNFVNPKTNLVLSKIDTGSKKLKIKDINLENFKIVNGMRITPIYEEYSNIGVAVYFHNIEEDDENEEENIDENVDDENSQEIEPETPIIKIENTTNNISSKTGTIFFTFLKEFESVENISKSNFYTNIVFDFSTNLDENNILNLQLNMDIFLTNEPMVFTIIKAFDDEFYYIEMNNENNLFVLNNHNNPVLINFSLSGK